MMVKQMKTANYRLDGVWTGRENVFKSAMSTTSKQESFRI